MKPRWGRSVSFEALPPIQEQGHERLVSMIVAVVQKCGATLLILDGYSSLRDLYWDSGRLSTLVHDLAVAMSALECTTLLTSATTFQNAAVRPPEFTMCDGLIELAQVDAAEEARAAERELERLLQRKSILADANALLNSSLESDENVRKLAALALPELATCGVIQLFRQGELERLELAHVDAGIEAGLRAAKVCLGDTPQLKRITELAMVTGQPQVQPCETNDSRMLGGLPMSACLAVPLRARGELLGVLAYLRERGAPAFDPVSDVDYAIELAHRASIAIHNARLYQEAQQAIRMREDVLAIVAHDLRNPLGAIAMSTHRLLDNAELGEPNGIGNGLQLILRSVKHMGSLVDELLEVGSIQSEKLELRTAPADVSELIDDAIAMFEAMAHAKSITVTKHIELAQRAVACDRERVVRVIANLLGNAIKFTPARGRVVLQATRTGAEVRVSLRDDGPGIPREEREKLFERYWKGASTGRNGIGLGLYIARGIIEAHGGRITVDSEVGVGSSFTFSLPAG